MVSKTANIATKKLKTTNADSTLYDLLGIEEDVQPEEWVDTPAFEQKKNAPTFSVVVSFRNKEDLDKFADLINQPHLKTEGKRSVKSTWYPPLATGERGQNNLFVWADEDDPEVQALLNGDNDE